MFTGSGRATMYLNPPSFYPVRMRQSLRCAYILTIPTFCVIGIPLLLYGGLNIPYSLTSQEAQAAGANQLAALEKKRVNSVEYKEMLIGVGFFGAACTMTALCVLTMWLCPQHVVEPEPEPGPSTGRQADARNTV